MVKDLQNKFSVICSSFDSISYQLATVVNSEYGINDVKKCKTHLSQLLKKIEKTFVLIETDSDRKKLNKLRNDVQNKLNQVKRYYDDRRKLEPLDLAKEFKFMRKERELNLNNGKKDKNLTPVEVGVDE